MLLEISEKLAGHPNLKSIRDEAAEDLKELVECPPDLPYKQATVDELETILNSEDDREVTINPDGSVTEAEPEKVVRRKL